MPMPQMSGRGESVEKIKARLRLALWLISAEGGEATIAVTGRGFIDRREGDIELFNPGVAQVALCSARASEQQGRIYPTPE
jgi:hypothetical protein